MRRIHMLSWAVCAVLVLGCQKSKSGPVVGGLGKPLAMGQARDLRITPNGAVASYLTEVEKPRLAGIPPQMVTGALYVVSIDGGRPRKVADGVTNMPGGQLFSPNSKWCLALAGYNAATKTGELVVVDVTDSQSQVTRLGQDVSYFLSSPDSATLAYVEKSVLKLFDYASKNAVALAGEVATAEFSPDSRWVFFRRRGRAASGLWVSDKGLEPKKLADQVGDYLVAPDSKSVVFQQKSDAGVGTYDLFIAEAPGFKPRRVAESSSRFAFSKDGKWLIRTQGARLQDALNYVGELYVGPAHGRQARKVGEKVDNFYLSPDSQHVAFLDNYDLERRQGRLSVAPLAQGDAVFVSKRVKTMMWSPDSARLAFQAVFFTEFGPSPDLMFYVVGQEKPTRSTPWVFGYEFTPDGQGLIARGNCSRVGPSGMPKACELLFHDFSKPDSPPKKLVEGVYSFKLSEDGKRLLITYSRMDSETYDVAVYDFDSQVLKTLDVKANVPAYFVGKRGERAVYAVADAERAGVYWADVNQAVVPPPSAVAK